jgi:hypothetical protein
MGTWEGMCLGTVGSFIAAKTAWGRAFGFRYFHTPGLWLWHMVCKPFGQFFSEDMVMMMSLGDEIKADPDKLKRFLWSGTLRFHTATIHILSCSTNFTIYL